MHHLSRPARVWGPGNAAEIPVLAHEQSKQQYVPGMPFEIIQAPGDRATAAHDRAAVEEGTMKHHKTAKIIILLITGFILSAIAGTQAFASVAWLSSIPVKAAGSDDGSAPGRIALDSQGNMYVTDRRNEKDRVIVFDRSGAYVRTLAGLKSPVSVAVDANSKIYVGNAETGSIDV